MQNQVNTDGRFWAYKTVARLADRTGMFRAVIIRFSDIYNWSETALAATIDREQLPAKLIGPLTREEYDALEPKLARIGYCRTSDVEAPIEFRDWTPLY